MSKKRDNHGQDELQDWINLRLDAAVQELLDGGIVDSALVEAKPAWIFPFQILLGKLREKGESSAFKWFICGKVPTDYVDYGAAATPREAARHFALKWQLEAARYQDPSVQKALGTPPDKSWEDIASNLANKAEALYAAVNDDRWWPDHS